MLVRNLLDVFVDYDKAVLFMDDDLCDALHDKLAPCSEQEFFSAYEMEHLDKFGKFWEFSKRNPQI